MNHTNRIAIVRGASKGIGAAIVKRLAADGLRTIVRVVGSTDRLSKRTVDGTRLAGQPWSARSLLIGDPLASSYQISGYAVTRSR
ncbi:hypothetical protein SAMN05414139_08953 [Burkholderia sp. D7]|nr:hypothetical protein SAMN05414139_08953 [Burkholderia sp. D7]